MYEILRVDFQRHLLQVRRDLISLPYLMTTLMATALIQKPKTRQCLTSLDL